MRLQWIILFCCSCFGILNTQMPPPIPPRSSSLARFGSRGYGSRIPSITKETIEMREKSLHRSVTTSPITTQMPKVIEVPKIFTKTVEQKAASEVPETKAAMIKIPEIGAVSAKKADYLDDKLEEAYKEFEDSLKLFEPTPRERLTHLREVKLNKFTNIGALSEKADYDGLRNQSELVIIEDLKEKMLPNSSHSN
ncbi:unnamed protein product, partial [Thelazia callipaeda]|uniref:Uncharacterized protein n=1 Tax=Thelazia callipaeda TaxID=103827 RepID=A0A0N5CT81_THECL